MRRSTPHVRSAITLQGLFLLATLGFMVNVATIDATKTSRDHSTLPQRYVVIDLGANYTPVAFNNMGSVVLSTTTGQFIYWSNGTAYPITGLSSIAGMNNSGRVVGMYTNNAVVMTGTGSDGVAFTESFARGGIWTNGATAIPLPNPTQQFVYGAMDLPQSALTVSGTTAFFNYPLLEVSSMMEYPTGIADNGAVYGMVEEYYYPDGGPVGLGMAIFPARLDTAITPLVANYSVYGDGLSGLRSQAILVGGVNIYLAPGTVAANGGTFGYQVTESVNDFQTEYDGYETIYGYPIEMVNGTTFAPDPATFVAYDGSAFNALSGIPAWIASNGNILGYNDSNLAMWTNYASAPASMTNAIGGAFNITNQIISSSSYWETNQLSDLTGQIQSGTTNIPVWIGINAQYINDKNTIVGIAGKTRNNDDTLATPLYPANYFYSGSAVVYPSHAIMLIPDKIQRDGQDITGTNANVWVGQQICLTNVISGFATNVVTSYHWHIPGVTGSTNDTAFYDYDEPNQINSNYTNLITPTDYTTNNYINFYWCGDATNLPVSCTQVIYGQTNTVTATLNVQRPNAVISTDHGVIAVDAGSYRTIQSGTNFIIDPSTALHFGSALTGATPGMKFGVDASAFPAGSNSTNNIIWNQVVNSDLSVVSTATSALTSTNSGGYDSGGKPGDYPYNYGNEADDSPGRAGLQTNYTSSTRSFTATMYLMWQPSTNMVGGDKTVPVALKCWPWHWSATATNGAPSAGWGLENSTYPSTTSDVDVTSPPIWTNAAPYEWQHSGSL